MALNNIRKPDAFVFTGNSIPVRFIATDYLQQAGEKAKFSLTFTGAVAGTAINFKYGGKTVTMTASATPNTTGLQFPNGDGSAAYVAGLLNYFKANYILNTDFELTHTAGTSTLVFEAKEKGTGFNLLVGTFANHTIAQITAGAAEIIKENYAVYFAIYLQNETHSAYSKLYETTLPLKYCTDVAETDLKDLLNTSLLSEVINNGLDAPIPGDLTPLNCKRTTRKFYYQFAEVFGANAAVQSLQTSEVFTALLGGLSYTSAFSQNHLTLFKPHTTDKTQDRFLTYNDKSISVRADEPRFLTFLNHRESTSAQLKVRFTFTDNTVYTLTLSTFTLNTLEKYSFNLRFDLLHLTFIQPNSTYNAKQVLKYEAYLSNGSANISETRTFFIDRSYQQQCRYFVYQNALGCADTVKFTGVQSSAFDQEQAEAQRNRQSFEAPQKGSAFVYAVNQQNKFSIATGWLLTKENLLKLRAFYASVLKYRYTQGYFLPIKLSGKTIAELSDDNFNHAQSFDYEYLFTEDAYSEFDGLEADFNPINI